MRLPNTGLEGPWRAVHCRPAPLAAERPFCPHGTNQFVRLHNSFAFTGTCIDYFFRAGAGTISIRSPSQFVRLHGKPHRLFFRAGARMEPHQFGQIFCARDRASEASFTLFFYLPPSVGLLLTILGKIFCTRLRSRMRGIFRSFLLSTAERQLTADRVDRFSVRAIAHVRHLSFFFIYRRASAHSSNLWNVVHIFSVRIVFEQKSIRSPSGK